MTVRVCGAGEGSVTANGTDWPGATVTFAGNTIAPALWTVTVAVPLETLEDVAAAVTVVDPEATPLTAMVAVVALAAMVTDAGMVTIPAVPVLKLASKPPAGAGPERVSVRFCVCPAETVRLGGVSVSVAVVCTALLLVPKPGAEALMVAGPGATPVI